MYLRALLAGATFALAASGCLRPVTETNSVAEAAGRPALAGGSSIAQGTGPVPQELSDKPAAGLMFSMAEGLEKGGKDEEAIAYYERARALDAKLADRASRRLAVLYDKADDQARAMHEFQDLLKKKPKDASLLNDVGYSYYNRANWAEAENYLRKAVTADKAFKPAWVNLGLALAQQGKNAEALDAFAHAVSPAEAYANLGFVFTVQGKRQEAYAAYRRSLELEPALKISQAAIARLERGDFDQPKASSGGAAPARLVPEGPASIPAAATGFASPNEPAGLSGPAVKDLP